MFSPPATLVSPVASAVAVSPFHVRETDHVALLAVEAIRGELEFPMPADVDVLLSALEAHVLGGEAHVNVVDGIRDTFLDMATWHGLDWTATARALAAFAALRHWIAGE